MDDDKFWRNVLAVIIGAVVVGAAGFMIRMWFVQRAVDAMQQSIAASAASMQAAAVRAQEEQAARARAAREEQIRIQQAEIARREKEAALLHAEQLKLQAKEEAWKRYYRRPSHCDVAEGTAFVECANDYIRAKRRFEEQYAAGKFQSQH